MELNAVVLFSKFFSEIDYIFEDERLAVSVKSQIKGGLVAGISATIGGILLGPRGLVAGAALGSLVMAASQANEGIEAPLQILMRLSDNEKKRIMEKVARSFNRSLPQFAMLLNDPRFLLDNKDFILRAGREAIEKIGYSIDQI